MVGVRESRQGQVLYTLQTDSIVSVSSLLEEGRSVQVEGADGSLILFTHDLIRSAAPVETETFPNILITDY